MKYKFPMVIPVAIERMLSKVRWIGDVIKTHLLAYIWGIELGKGVLFQGRTLVRTRQRGSISIGEYSVFNSHCKSNLVGLTGPTILDVRHGGRIIVGSYSGCSSVVISSKTRVEIGNQVKIGGNVRIFDHDFHSLEADVRRGPDDLRYIRTAEVVIGDDVFIGTNAIILKGSHIGPRSIVAAGSVVFGLDVPPDSLVKGNPAQILK